MTDFPLVAELDLVKFRQGFGCLHWMKGRLHFLNLGHSPSLCSLNSELYEFISWMNFFLVTYNSMQKILNNLIPELSKQRFAKKNTQFYNIRRTCTICFLYCRNTMSQEQSGVQSLESISRCHIIYSEGLSVNYELYLLFIVWFLSSCKAVNAPQCGPGWMHR